ncbi:MAG TPA: nucleoside diphosphate kinase regulator [Bacteroidales bacterium]|jgi:regulator of nucleoside diphosphate kinase|nr:nucleoside diphosphate kinase regulator [Bacteroidales bacterium]OQB61472.1 MAG: Regulator of nucleoside diphosphate kinase [Bacteroidetes bacterium ADurb.Bin145]NMD02472.1 nucleoside diphosphate kinase regulator [Bacteroidales bacterium]HOU02691.1 nucleoside diphosphate kinase regulator [Bacteroidales bacterium]HQG62702.1 nucleoside diphosphate kinase regulator [Bacteroidales bacterium]
MNTIILSKLDFSRIHKCIHDARRMNTIGANEAENLMKELSSAKVVEPEEIPHDVVTMNSIVKISFLNTKKTLQFQIVYPDQANFRENRISILSPVATALIGYKVSDEIEWVVPSGLTKLRIDEIIYQPEAAGDFDR